MDRRNFTTRVVLSLFLGFGSSANTFAATDINQKENFRDIPWHQIIQAETRVINPRVPVPTPTMAPPRARAAATVGGAWVSRGPAPMQGQGVENITNGEASGAAHTMALHPTNADIAWVAGANGGVWKTTNATAASPSWTPLTDSQPSLSIGAMELDPTDSASNTLVACFGRFSSFGGEGGLLNGLIRSTDGGSTWTHITNTLLENQSCSGIAVRGSTIVFSSVSFDGGVFRSADTGASWIKVSSGLPSDFAVQDMVGDPANTSRLYATVNTQGIYRSDDAGASWSRISSADQNVIFAEVDATGSPINNNAEMSVASNGRLYVAIINGGQAVSIQYTDNPTDGAPSWVAMDIPTVPVPNGAIQTITDATNASPIVVTTSAAHGFADGNFVQISGVTGNTAANGIYGITLISDTAFSLRLTSGNGAYASGGSAFKVQTPNPKIRPGGQGSIHFSILADRNNSNIVYVGGDSGDLPSFYGAQSFTGSLWRGDTSVSPTDASPSPQWAHLTHSNAITQIPTGGTASSSAPHADSREMFQDANGNIVEVDDGGIYRRSNPTSNAGDWTSMNGNLGNFEQHSIAYDTISNIMISGNQDNGTSSQNSTNSNIWTEVAGGDGGDVAVDSTTALPNSIRYLSSQNNGGFSRITYDANNQETDFAQPALTGSGDWSPNFVTTIELNPTNQARFVLAGTNGILETSNKGDSVTYLATAAINEGAITYGASDNADALYAGSGNNVLVRVSGLGAPTATATQFPGEDITDLMVNPTSANTLYVLDAASVYMTTDAGANWTNITGNISNSLMRSLEFIPGASPSIAVGGVGGVSLMKISEPGVWNALGSGLPNTIVYDLDYDQADNLLVVGTLGRGAWTLGNVVESAPVDTDGDGIPNETDTDDDGDGTPDSSDAFPLDSSETTDSDGDGVGDNSDSNTPIRLDPSKEIQLNVVGLSLNAPAGSGLTVPQTATAVSLNVTVVSPASPGFITVYPCGVARPLASNVNYVAGQVVPNGVVAPIGSNGKVCFFSSQETDLVVDVAGWFAGDAFTGATPKRLVDSRDGTGSPVSKLTSASPLEVQITNVSVTTAAGASTSVPSNISAAALNLTVTNPDSAGFVTAYPCDVARPNASNVNYVAGQTVANGVLAPVSAAGQVCLFSSVPTDVIVDIGGWFGSSSFSGSTPTRLVDTRDGTGGRQGAISSTDELSVPIRGVNLTVSGTTRAVPTAATAAALNVTVVSPSAPGFVTVYPCGVARPLASNLNYVAGDTVANNVIAPIGSNGSVCLFSQSSTEVIVDISGWFEGSESNGFVGSTPKRLVDTRDGTGPGPR